MKKRNQLQDPLNIKIYNNLYESVYFQVDNAQRLPLVNHLVTPLAYIFGFHLRAALRDWIRWSHYDTNGLK